MTTSLFSESWYRIAQQRVALRSHVSVRRQYFRGERWYVLQDPFNNQFFRLRPGAYDFVVRLRSRICVSQTNINFSWNDAFGCHAWHPDHHFRILYSPLALEFEPGMLLFTTYDPQLVV